MPREKARTPARKTRPASKGPKKRVGGNHGNGKKFQPGTNSHDASVFRRGPDDIPRGSISLMYRTVMHDARVKLYTNLVKLTETPRGALAFAEAAGDRLEGRPTQRHEVGPVRQAIFSLAPDDGTPPPPPGPPGAPPSVAAPPREVALIGPDGERFRAL